MPAYRHLFRPLELPGAMLEGAELAASR